LPDDYIKKNPNIDVLKKVLGFKPDIYDQIPEDVRERYEITKNIPIEELRKLVSKSEKESSVKEETTWTPENEPHEVDVKIKKVEPNKIITPDLTGQGGPTGTGDGKKPIGKGEKTKEKTQSDKKAIGEWGEKYVYHALQKDYKKLGTISETDSGFKAANTSNEEFEIVWLNKYSEQGEGYDFVVKKNGVEIEYIEVKTKTQEDAELIEVTGTQWEFARKLFDQDEGEKYFFLCGLECWKRKY
jgi:hypothetical protein